MDSRSGLQALAKAHWLDLLILKLLNTDRLLIYTPHSRYEGIPLMTDLLMLIMRDPVIGHKT